MKRSSIIFSLVFLGLTACNSYMNINREKQALLAADRAFSELSVEKGVPAAFDQFMVDDAVIFRDQALPFEGREQIRKLFANYPDATLIWEPYLAEVAASGDLGYTLGCWTFSLVNENGETRKSTGRYVTIWKKQADDSWKYVFDTGISDPEDSPE
ncbi:MAG: DUF4440 domain-containing protein [Candidatus Neomarinimicrobiota bacterium]